MKLQVFLFLRRCAPFLLVSDGVSLRGPVRGPGRLSLSLYANSSAPSDTPANFSNSQSSSATTSYCSTDGLCLEYEGAEDQLADDFPYQYNITEFELSLKSQRSQRVPELGEQILDVADKNKRLTRNVCMKGKLVPSFYLLGAQKSATSSFASEIAKGENVVLPRIVSWTRRQKNLFAKELHFFDAPKRWQRGKQFWLNHWPKCPSTHMVAADFTPSYLSTWEAPMRLKTTYGPQSWKLNFLIILREPLARMQSSYYHGMSSRWISDKYKSKYKTFQSYVEAAIWNFDHQQYRKFHDCSAKKDGSEFLGNTGIPFSLSLYKEQIEHWTQHFKASQFMVAPMQTYTNPRLRVIDGKPGLVETVAKWRALNLEIPPKQANPRNPPRLNRHPHPEATQDLTRETYLRITQVLNQATGSQKLAELLSPLMKQGLVLYGHEGYPGDTNQIARYIEDNW